MMTRLRYVTPFSKRHLQATLAALSLLSAAAPKAALADSALIAGARQCTQYFPVEEKKNAIPTHLLAAIATTESGRYDKDLGMAVPWPWTINVDGKGYYFSSKAEAMAQVQSLLARGHQSVDVGCMQVNLKYHPRAFASLDQAFDPAVNVAYAAKFLRDNYATYGDWIKATAAYHSATPLYGNRYLVEIEHSWNRIVAKVNEARAAKAASGDTTTEALGASTDAAPAPKVVQQLTRVVTMPPAMQNSHHARVISVSDAVARRSSAVMVVHEKPETPVAPLGVAGVQPPGQALDSAQSSVPQPVAATATYTATGALPTTPAAAPVAAGDSVRRVNLDNQPEPVLPSVKPKFVFAN